MTSHDKIRFTIAAADAEAFHGLRFFTMKNIYRSSVIPSTKNFVNTHQIKKVQCDDTATCSVFPISDTNMLDSLFQHHTDCMFSLTQLRSGVTGSTTLALTIHSPETRPAFNLRLGLDIYPNETLYSESQDLTQVMESRQVGAAVSPANCLMFPVTATYAETHWFLCREDIDFMLDREDVKARLAYSRILGYLAQYDHRVERRDSAVLGNDFLGRADGASITFQRVTFYFNAGVHHLQDCSWNRFRSLVPVLSTPPRSQTRSAAEEE